MALRLVTGPAEQPVTLDEARMHLRVSEPDEDSMIKGLIIAATQWAESIIEGAIVTQTFEVILDAFPDARTQWRGPPDVSPSANIPLIPLGRITQGHIALRSPLQTVNSVKYVDPAGILQTMDPAQYVVEQYDGPGFVRPAFGCNWPSYRRQGNAVIVNFTAGFGNASQVPQAIKQAILLLIGQLYLYREATINLSLMEPPFSVHSLLSYYRTITIPM